MTSFVAAFVLFLLAVAGMAVGVLLKGKRLSGSCGGRGPDGRPLGECLCARENRPTCDSPPADLFDTAPEPEPEPVAALGRHD
jgi:hypothetical protein